MTETQYKEIKAKPVEFPVRDLIEITGDRSLVASLDAFGPNTYVNNQAEMQKAYSHPQTGARITFRSATTAETILINARNFKNQAKPKILDPRWLQLGYIVRTSEGVFINPQVQRDEKGSLIIDEEILKSFLKSDKKVNRIYLLDDAKHFAFVPYESFTRDVQDSGDFARGGLARGLEYVARKEAPILRKMSDKKYYPRGVNVWGYDSVKKLILRVASLDSDRSIGDSRLSVGGGWDGSYDGYASGVWRADEVSEASQKN